MCGNRDPRSWAGSSCRWTGCSTLTSCHLGESAAGVRRLQLSQTQQTDDSAAAGGEGSPLIASGFLGSQDGLVLPLRPVSASIYAGLS